MRRCLRTLSCHRNTYQDHVGASLLVLGTLIVFSMAAYAREDPDDRSVLDVHLSFGSTGDAPGKFVYPRGVAVDWERQFVYVIDKTARVQRFSFDGTLQFEWRMPESEYGKPTGLTVAPDGRLFVADTHYSRVIVYDSEGRELMRIGRYGQGPGMFIFPTDVALGPEGRVYVAEYGGNDRIQVFTAEGKYVREFGSLGRRVGQFNQPRALVFNADKTELYIADAGNHRIVVTDPEGRILRILGEPGQKRGQFAYPYDLIVLADGSLLVCEFRNQRLQHLSADGQCLGLLGRVGSGEGELQYPWGIDGTHDKIFVLDSGNNRVKVISPPLAAVIGVPK